MNQTPDVNPVTVNSGSTSSRLSVRILCLLILLYIPVQWIGGRRPGSTSIFSPQHQVIERQFLDVTAVLRGRLLRECAQNGIRDIYFTDGDVISPYLLDDIEAVPGCSLHRETVVTPIADAPKLACSAIIVDEGIPNPWNPYYAWDYLGSLQTRVVVVSAWDSEEKLFNFRLLQARNCAHDDYLAEAPQGPAAP